MAMYPPLRGDFIAGAEVVLLPQVFIPSLLSGNGVVDPLLKKFMNPQLIRGEGFRWLALLG